MLSLKVNKTLPTLRNIPPDITLQSAISQLQQHPETKELRTRIEGMQDKIQQTINTVLRIFTGSGTKFPTLTGLHHPEQLAISGAEEDLTKAQASAGAVDFRWLDGNKNPLQLKTDELKLLTVIEDLFYFIEKAEAAISLTQSDFESVKSRAREKLSIIAGSFKEHGLIITEEQLDTTKFNNAITDQEEKIRDRVYRKEWKQRLKTHWEKQRADIEKHLGSMDDSTTKRKLEKIRELLEIKQSQRDLITGYIEQYGSSDPEKTQNLSAISSGLEILLAQLRTESRELGIDIENKTHHSETLKALLNTEITVKFAKKKREKKTPTSGRNPALPAVADEAPAPVPTTSPARSSNRLKLALIAAFLAIGAGIGIKMGKEKTETQNPTPATARPTLAEEKIRVHQYTNFELDARWADYCQRMERPLEYMEAQIINRVLMAVRHWLNEFGTLGNLSQVPWKIIPSRDGSVLENMGPNDLVLIEGQEPHWGEVIKQHMRSILMSQFAHDPLAYTLLANYEQYCDSRLGGGGNEFMELFPDMRKLPINTDPDALNTEHEIFLESMVVHEAIRNYPGLSPDFIKRLLKKILTSPRENDFFAAHIRDGQIISPGFLPYIANLDFFKNILDGNMTGLNDIAFKNGRAFIASVRCVQVTQNGRTRWRIQATNSTFVIVKDSGNEEITFGGSIFCMDILPGTRRVILKRDGIELVSRDIPPDFQFARPPHVMHEDGETFTREEIDQMYRIESHLEEFIATGIQVMPKENESGREVSERNSAEMEFASITGRVRWLPDRVVTYQGTAANPRYETFSPENFDITRRYRREDGTYSRDGNWPVLVPADRLRFFEGTTHPEDGNRTFWALREGNKVIIIYEPWIRPEPSNHLDIYINVEGGTRFRKMGSIKKPDSNGAVYEIEFNGQRINCGIINITADRSAVISVIEQLFPYLRGP